MTEPKQGPRQKLKQLIQNIEESFERWSYLITTGGSDPFYTDGCNANLVRNHIIYYKKEIIELCSENNLTTSEIITRPTPEGVSDSYMAKSDEIRTDAQKSLIVLKNNADYLFLKEIVHSLPGRIIHESSINNVLGYVQTLQRAIKEDDLIVMRRMRNPDGYLDSFSSCATRIREMTTDLDIKRQVNISDSEEHIITPFLLSSPIERQVTKQLDLSSFL